ncbi:hypothetical protein [Niabella ginsenosidivorans]|nr:hypothetical protein [Niabella ginsenosidivorans]
MLIRDVLYRQIELSYFILLGAGILFYSLLRCDRHTILVNFFVNSLIIAMMTGALILVYALKKKNKNFFHTKLGAGDVLFWILVTPLFAPANFILWMIFSLLLSLLPAAGQTLKKGTATAIPLAGYQSGILVAVLLLNNFLLHCNLFEEPLFLPAL